jgi:hypothetical protein
LWVAENDLDNRIPAGHAAFLNSSPYTRFGYTSPERVRRVATLEGFGIGRTRAEQAPGRYGQWLEELRAGQES